MNTTKRTTISMSEELYRKAVKRMTERGFNENFSAYVADLLRRDQEARTAALDRAERERREVML